MADTSPTIALDKNASPMLEEIRHVSEETGLPPDKAANLIRIVEQEVTFRAGPLPSAEEMLKYEQVCPGAARDIIEMAKSRQQHTQNFENRRLASEHIYRLIGLTGAIFIFLSILIAIIWLTVIDAKDIALGLGAVLALTGLFSVFIRGRSLFEKSEKTSKSE
jgi:uncharacterized membrane protein